MSLVHVYLALMVCLIPFCKSDQDTLNNEFCAVAMSITDMCTANGYVPIPNPKPDTTHHPSTIEPNTPQAVGCPDIASPTSGWVKHDGMRAVITCNLTGEVRHLVCNGTSWVGDMAPCATNLKPDTTHHPTTIEPNTPQVTPSTCPIGFEEAGRKCLKHIFYSDYGTTWFAARDYCQGIDADLVSIQSQLEQNAVQDFITRSALTTNQMPASSRHHWIGLNDQVTEGVYVWADGTAASYTHWGGNKPGGFGGDDCVFMNYASYDFGWSDFSCTARATSFICEI